MSGTLDVEVGPRPTTGQFNITVCLIPIPAHPAQPSSESETKGTVAPSFKLRDSGWKNGSRRYAFTAKRSLSLSDSVRSKSQNMETLPPHIGTCMGPKQRPTIRNTSTT